MTERTHIQVPRGRRIFEVLQEHGKSLRPRLSEEETAKRKAENEEFGKRCREIFDRVYPELVKDYYNWYILIEPDSGDYFIDSDERIASEKGHQKHPTAVMLMMRLNETGTCGRI
jgi:hypothetical protein